MTLGIDLAYPLITGDGINLEIQYNCGLTKREYFAVMALQGLCNEGAWSDKIHKQSESIGSNSSIAIATYAVDLADELINALNK